MHPEALEGVSRAVHWSGLLDWPIRPLKAMDLGGADVNGTARGRFPLPLLVEWQGADIQEGAGVDHVFDATEDPPAQLRSAFDIVLCTEVLEHVERWKAVVRTIFALLKPGGFAFITCASAGRRPHGARGAMDPAPGEWYSNVNSLDLDIALDAIGFSDYMVTFNPNPGDAYAWARK